MGLRLCMSVLLIAFYSSTFLVFSLYSWHGTNLVTVTLGTQSHRVLEWSVCPLSDTVTLRTQSHRVLDWSVCPLSDLSLGITLSFVYSE